MTESANSSMNHTTERNGHNSDGEDPKADAIMPESSWQFRCVSCYQMFPTAEAFRQHYLSEHIQATICVKREQDGDDDRCNDGPDQDKVAEPRTFCKRCRARILSSSEEEDDTSSKATPKKAKLITAGDEPATIPNKGSNDGLSPESSTALRRNSCEVSVTPTKGVDSSAKNASPVKCAEFSRKSIVDNQKKDGVVNTGMPILARMNSPSTKAAGPDEIVVNLLKDANALSKVYKVVILNFFNGRRVNPDPAKGAVQVIRLGEKKDTVTAEDGSQKTVIQESYVKLNFETGDWERIMKTKSIQSDEPSSTP